jgi:choline dehydrogenase
VKAVIAGLKFVDRIFAAPALAKYVVGRNSPVESFTNDADWEKFLKTYTFIGFHPVATCRMGGDAASVVDPTLKARGVTGLRIIDASVLPTMPSANTNAPTFMVAEKGADMIKQDAR